MTAGVLVPLDIELIEYAIAVEHAIRGWQNTVPEVQDAVSRSGSE